MSKKDYTLIARVLSGQKPVNTDQTQEEFAARLRLWENVCKGLAWELARENPAFDTDKFLNACK